MFERFHRGRAGRAGPAGTGLGLPIARELARRWGGDVELANRPEGGAAARITVPAPPREGRAFRSLTAARATVAPGMTRAAILWCLAALAGVVLVAGVTYAASGLSSQAIGLSSEPLGAGDDLCPPQRHPTPSPTGAADAPRRRAPGRRTARRGPRGRAPAAGAGPRGGARDARADRGPDGGPCPPPRRRSTTTRVRRRLERRGPRPGPGRDDSGGATIEPGPAGHRGARLGRRQSSRDTSVRVWRALPREARTSTK